MVLLGEEWARGGWVGDKVLCTSTGAQSFRRIKNWKQLGILRGSLAWETRMPPGKSFKVADPSFSLAKPASWNPAIALRFASANKL